MVSPDPPPAVVATLRAAGCVFAEDEAALLAAAAVSHDELDAMVARRASGVPLEHVLGWAEFCGLRIAVAPGVFVPRRRTECLVRQAVAAAPPRPVAVDLCCGTGAVAAALAAALSLAELHAADLDPAAVACARLNLATEMLVHGARDEGRELLVACWGTAHDMGARDIERRAVRLATRSRVPLPESARGHGPLSRLTPREREVLDLLATGATNKSIAETLFVTEKTASVHVSNLLAKLGVTNRGEAAALARQLVG